MGIDAIDNIHATTPMENKSNTLLKRRHELA